jgi:hypothetical protein
LAAARPLPPGGHGLRKEAAMNEQRVTIQTIAQFLDARQWHYHVTDDGRIESGFHGKTARFPLRLALHGEQFLKLTAIADLPFVVPEEKRGQVAEVIVRANYGQTMHRFDMDMRDGRHLQTGGRWRPGVDLSSDHGLRKSRRLLAFGANHTLGVSG